MHAGQTTEKNEPFVSLLLANEVPLRRQIAHAMGRLEDADEVFQRTAIVLWEKFEDYDSERPFLPWATAVARFEVLRFRSENARTKLFFDEATVQALTDSRSEIESELDLRQRFLSSCIRKLDAADRVFLECRYSGDRPLSEVASEMGRTIKSVYRRLDRVRDALTRCIDREMSRAEIRGDTMPGTQIG